MANGELEAGQLEAMVHLAQSSQRLEGTLGLGGGGGGGGDGSDH